MANILKIKKQDQQKILNLWCSGTSARSLAKTYNVSDRTIANHLKKLNPNYKALRPKTSNENFFDVIDTQEKAYVLGLWYADGYNNQSNNAASLRLTDLDLMQDVARVMDFKRKLFENCKNKYNQDKYNRSTSYGIELYGKHLCEQLASKGCPQNKTQSIVFPSHDIVPEYLIHHFVRGYFDGDGSVFFVKRTTRLSVEFISNKEFCNGILKTIPAQGNIRDRTYTEVSDLRIGKQQEIYKLYWWLYKDASIFLKRKHDIFVTINDRFEQKSEI